MAEPARLVGLAMDGDLDRYALAAIAGRLLARAVASADAWSAVAALCHALWERTRESTYREQAEEAERRAHLQRAVPGRPSTPVRDLHGWRPDDPAAWVLGVRHLLVRGDTETIARALGVVGGSFGPGPFALASEEALAAGAHVPARVFAELGLTLFPDAPALHVTRAGALLLAGDVPAARVVVDALVLAHPGDAHGWLLRAAVDRAEGKDPARSLATAEALAPRGSP